MATIGKTNLNQFNFMRFRRITNGVISEIPVCEEDPIIFPTPSPTHEIYYGSDVQSDPALVDILGTGLLAPQPINGEINIPYSGANGFLWVAYPTPEINNPSLWRETLDASVNGTIDVDVFFLSPTIKIVNGEDYFIIMSNASIIQTPFTFY